MVGICESCLVIGGAFMVRYLLHALAGPDPTTLSCKAIAEKIYTSLARRVL